MNPMLVSRPDAGREVLLLADAPFHLALQILLTPYQVPGTTTGSRARVDS
jgi:hypothetical protein